MKLYVTWLVLAISGYPGAAEARDLPDVLGVTHVAGKYHFTDKPFLAEGADEILTLGSRVIKVWFDNLKGSYPYNSDWPEVNNLVEIARTPYFRDLFDKPFTTYILMCFAVGQGGAHFRDGMSDDEKRFEYEQFHALAEHLLTQYRGTGKTFVLQHWEGDWLIRGNFDAKTDPTPQAIEGMIAWLNARQAGVDDARRKIKPDGVRVYHSAEVNLVVQSMNEDRPGLINKVIPQTRVDLVSYSAWDSVIPGDRDPNLLRHALDFIAANTPDHPDFGNRNVYMGEFGVPTNEFEPSRVRMILNNAVETGLEWGCPWVVYWQLYCNELNPKADNPKPPVKANQDVRGFWMIRPDGARAWPWEYYHGLLKTANPLTQEH